jgi:hypothetical protein
MKAKTMQFEDFMKLFKSLSNPIRNYGNVFLVTESGELVFSDGFMIIIAKCRHTFLQGVYKFDGQSSPVAYPNYKGILPKDGKDHVEIPNMLKIAAAIKPSGKTLTTLSIHGKINDNDADYTCNLVHVNTAVKLGCDIAEMTPNGLFIFTGDSATVYSAGVKPTN